MGNIYITYASVSYSETWNSGTKPADLCTLTAAYLSLVHSAEFASAYVYTGAYNAHQVVK